MFGSINAGTDYTFTQSEAQVNTVNKSKIISKYFGNNGVSQKPNSEVNNKNSNTKSPSKSISTDDNGSLKKNENNSDVPQIKILGQGQDDDGNDYLYNSDGKAQSITNSFDALAAAVGGIGGKITKEQLVSYLHSLTSDVGTSAANAQEVTFIKSLIAQFDSLSGGTSYITSLDGAKEPQDYKTITKEQVTLPIDVRV